VLKAKQDGLLESYAGKPEPGLPGHTIFHIWPVGCFGGSLREVDVRLFHCDQRLRKPVSINQQLRVSPIPRLIGSSKVAHLLYESNDQRFACFRRAMPERPEDLTLSEGVEIAKSYINACDSDEGRAEDPDVCPAIGGRRHVATITVRDGFRWIPGFEH
jgi:hypothetical protein